MCGAFHLVPAITAASDNDRSQAHKHPDQAPETAEGIGEDRGDFGTESGPASVALHPAGVAVEPGEAGEALALAWDINPGRRPARYDIGLARAYAMRRQAGQARRCREEAERLTPEQTRTHSATRAGTVADPAARITATARTARTSRRLGALP